MKYMRRLYAILTLFWGVGLCLNAQTITVEKPIVTHSQEKFKAVEASGMLHAIEGSSAVYKITVAGYDSIDSVISLMYNDTDVTSNCQWDEGVLTISDITINNLKVNETQEFKIKLFVRKKENQADTMLTADAMSIKVWPEPTIKRGVDPNLEETPKKQFLGDSWNLNVTPTGGFTDGWKIEWRDTSNGNVLSEDKTFDLKSSVTNEIDSKHIQLHVTNFSPEASPQSIWYEDICDYYIRFYPIPEVQFADSYQSNVIDGDEITMRVRLADNTKQMDDYSISCDWETDGALIHKFKALNKNNEDGSKEEVKVKCTLGLKDTDAKKETTLSHIFTVWPEASAVPSVASNTLEAPKLLFQDGELKISTSKWGGYRDGWSFLWKDENSGKELGDDSDYSVQCDASDNTIISKHISKHVSLTAKNKPNDSESYWYNETWHYYVSFYPIPIVKFDNIYPKNIITGNEVTMTLVIEDNLSEYYDLNCSWPNGKDEKSYVFTRTNESNEEGVKDIITVRYTAKLKDSDALEYKGSLDYEITTWPQPKVYSDELTNYVGCGGQTKDFNVVATGGRKGGWTYEWYKNDDIRTGEGTSTFKLNLINESVNGDSITDKYSVIVKNTSDGEEWFNEIYPFYVTIYPKPHVPDVPDVITLTDRNRGQKISEGIREGNEIDLDCAEFFGGYPNGWSYSWYCNDILIDKKRQPYTKVSANYTGLGKDNVPITYRCSVQNLYNTMLWKQEEYGKTIMVYRKPQTPTSLAIKGNGTSGTVITTSSVGDADLEYHEYYLVFGYLDSNGQMHDAASQRQLAPGEVRWSTQISSSEMNNPNNTLYVYALWKYNNGVEITSGLRYISSVDEYWDGSSFSGATRAVIADATAIDAISDDADSTTPQEYYSTNGLKSSKPSKGFNIVKMRDGSVKKMVVK